MMKKLTKSNTDIMLAGVLGGITVHPISDYHSKRLTS